MKSKIQVSVRLRPLNTEEIQRNEPEVIVAEGNSIKMNLEDVSRISTKSSTTKIFDRQKKFEFENVFGVKDNTASIYKSIVHDIVMKSIRGINSTIFVYGQTGSGKTYTMTGEYISPTSNIYLDQSNRLKSKSPIRSTRQTSSKSPIIKRSSRNIESRPQTPISTQEINRAEGLVTMALRKIFLEVDTAEKNGEEFILNCSYIEIYNELVYDLLRDFNNAGEQALPIFEDTDKAEFVVKGAIEESVTNYAEALEVLERGEKNRHFAATNLNHHSSRSHTIFRVFVKYVDKDGIVYGSTCNFVDLAGSEKLSKYQDENNHIRPERIKESKSINKSLFFLTQIINYKSTMKNDNFVPYRNSPLTKILKSSIGGNAKTAIILCINPAFVNIEQTLGTLKFGNLASRIENIVQRNSMESNLQDATLKNALQNYEFKLKELEAQLINGDKSGDYLKRIQQLEKQKQLLQQKYQNLLKLSMKASKLQDETGICRVELFTNHFNSCGIVDYYVVDTNNELNMRGKRKNLNKNFFEENKNYTKELFEKEVMAGKVKKITNLEQENENLKHLLEKSERQNFELTSRLDVCNRLLQIMLNNNQKDLSKFDNGYKDLFVMNALNMIENCKTESINYNLALNSSQQMYLAYKSNTEPQIELSSLTNKFQNIVNMEQSCESDDTTSLDLDQKGIPLKSQNSSNGLFKKKSKRKIKVEYRSSSEEIPNIVPKSLKVSSGYLLQD